MPPRRSPDALGVPKSRVYDLGLKTRKAAS